MCELLAITTKNNTKLNDHLDYFYKERSDFNRHGWGIFVFNNGSTFVDKEPIKAVESEHLQEVLDEDIIGNNVIAHVRFATTGLREYNNCHPYQYKDESGRVWTLAHNGTIFHTDMIDEVTLEPKGDTDSEKVILLIIESMNKKIEELGRPLKEKERFEVIENIIKDLSRDNKLNLMIYDGELLYIHANVDDQMFISPFRDGYILGSREYDYNDVKWEPFPKRKLIAFKDGEIVLEGSEPQNTYVEDPEVFRYYYLKYANL